MSSKKQNLKKAGANAPLHTESSTPRVTTVKAVDSRRSPAMFGAQRYVGRAVRPFMNRSLGITALSELIGTFLLACVFITQQSQPVALFFAVLGLFLVFGRLSGAHLNPAITVASWITRRMNYVHALVYVAAQLLGAMLAFLLLNSFISQVSGAGNQNLSLDQPSPELYKALAITEGKQWVVLAAELLGSVILGLFYARALNYLRRGTAAAFTAGSAYFVALALAGTAAYYVNSSAILNPAAAVALRAINLTNVWPVAIYFVTTAVGATFGFALYNLMQRIEINQTEAE